MAETTERRPAGEAGGAQDGDEHVRTRITRRGCPCRNAAGWSDPASSYRVRSYILRGVAVTAP